MVSKKPKLQRSTTKYVKTFRRDLSGFPSRVIPFPFLPLPGFEPFVYFLYFVV
jgi:hypothetical protein